MLLRQLRPWLQSIYEYYAEQKQWLVSFTNEYTENFVRERLERMGFSVVGKGDNYFVCEVTAKTRISEIRKLLAQPGIDKICPNWLVKKEDLRAK